MLFFAITVYSFNGRVPKIFSTFGLMYNSTKISAGPILRTYGNQVVPSVTTGQNIGSTLGGVGPRMAPS
jgi:hypothetical protein